MKHKSGKVKMKGGNGNGIPITSSNIVKTTVGGGILFSWSEIILLIFVIGLLFYILNQMYMFGKSEKVHRLGIVSPEHTDVFENPYTPPIQPPWLPTLARESIIQISTQPMTTSFSQIGILTNNAKLILPLFGRSIIRNRNKWQYYTISNTGIVSSKLPLRINGKDSLIEYGVDELSNGDHVYVTGYDDDFTATIYTTNSIPYIS